MQHVRGDETRGSQFKDTDDARLAYLAIGDPEAFAELYERHAPRVFRYVLTYAGSVDDAMDLTQHVFLQCFQALPRYRHEGAPFAAWLFRIARNAATDSYRRRRRVMPWDHLPEGLQPIALHDPEREVLRRESLNHLRVIVAGLDGDKQELLALRFAAGLSIHEIARLLGKSDAAIQKALWRLVESLREQYDER